MTKQARQDTCFPRLWTPGASRALPFGEFRRAQRAPRLFRSMNKKKPFRVLTPEQFERLTPERRLAYIDEALRVMHPRIRAPGPGTLPSGRSLRTRRKAPRRAAKS